MEYLFFDIECACVYKTTAKICAFGYCLTDENFNVLQKEDVLINPKGRFHLTDHAGKEGLVLPYDYDAFKNYPSFPQIYPVLVRMLQRKDVLIFGHATFNDVKYLNLETKRFHLKPFRFSFYDTQLLYMSVINSFERQYGLEGIAQALGVAFTPHRAADDAYATMRVAEALCKREGLTMPALLEKYGVLPGKTAEGETARSTSRPFVLYTEQHRREKAERERLHIKFAQYVDRKNHRRGIRTEENLQGRVFTFSREIENDLPRAKGFLDEIYCRGGRYSMKSEGCNVYVRAPQDNGRRWQNAMAAGAVIIELENFYAALTEGGL